MSLTLHWQAREVTLLLVDKGDPSRSIEPVRVDFNFELTPLTLISDKDRQHFTGLLAKLRGGIISDDFNVDLFIPPAWGITLEVPHPNLPDNQLEDHLIWELSKAMLGSVDHYRYGWTEGSGKVIHLAAMRIKLLELVNQTIMEAGFTLSGVYLDDPTYHSINLGTRLLKTRPVESAEIEESPEFREPPQDSASFTPTLEPAKFEDSTPDQEPASREDRETEPEDDSENTYGVPKRRSPWKIIIAAAVVILLLGVGFKLLNRPKPSSLPEPVPYQESSQAQDTIAQTQVESKPVVDTVSTQEKTPEKSPAVVPSDQSEPRPGELAETLQAERLTIATTSRRLSLLRELLTQADDCRISMATFTAGRFMIQLSGSDSLTVQTILNHTQELPGVTALKLKFLAGGENIQNANLYGEFTAETATASSAKPDSDKVNSLAEKRELTGKGMVYTGTNENVLAFLTDLAEGGYSFYRLVYMPWENQTFRLVLDL